ncbi:MAG: hypothetical protein B7733_05750 [Myxococcales bacterium FL481]|nr:MAG: hypothetical protein B7733_05750 [Myxococcales bacterium FL481]
MRAPLLAHTGWHAPAISDLPQDWSRYDTISVDTETNDPKLKELGPGDIRGDGHVAGFPLAFLEGERVRRYYLPVGHESGENMDRDSVLRYLAGNLRGYTGRVVGAKLDYEIAWWRSCGLEFRREVKFHDVLAVDALLDENQFAYNLDAVAKRNGEPCKSEAVLRLVAAAYGLDPKKDMWRLPPWAVGEYGEMDVELPLRIFAKQVVDIREQELEQAYDLDMRLLPVLCGIRRRGFKVDFDQMDRVERRLAEVIDSALKCIKHWTGIGMSREDITNVEPQVRMVKLLGATPPLTPKKQEESVNNEFLDGLDAVPAHALAAARRAEKMIGTFIKGTMQHVVGDRVHPSYAMSRSPANDQAKAGDNKGSVTRSSSFNPNIQQVPGRSDIAVELRKMYVPDSGEIVSADWKSQEPRVTAHYCEVTKYSHYAAEICPNWLEGEERDAFMALTLRAEETARAYAQAFRDDPNTDYHAMVRDAIGWAGKEGRKRAKSIGLGYVYGMGRGSMAAQMHLPTYVKKTKRGEYLAAGPEATAIIDEFEAKAPHLRMLSRVLEYEARRRGYVRDIVGRRCRFPRHPKTGERMYCHIAISRLIQRTSMTMMQEALIAMDDAGVDIVATIHDEVLTECHSAADIKEVERCMLVPARHFNVPHGVDIAIGPSWGHTMENE